MKPTPMVRLGSYMRKLGEERILPTTGLAVMGQLVGLSALTAEEAGQRHQALDPDGIFIYRTRATKMAIPGPRQRWGSFRDSGRS